MAGNENEENEEREDYKKGEDTSSQDTENQQDVGSQSKKSLAEKRRERGVDDVYPESSADDTTPVDVDQIIEKYNSPPSLYETTNATHYVHTPWRFATMSDDWVSEAALETKENGDLVTDFCTPLYSNMPDENFAKTEILTNLGHKSLVVVTQERVGLNGGWHFVRVVNTNPVIDGMVGYVDHQALVKLPGVPRSLPTLFGCSPRRKASSSICSLTVPAWHTTSEPYFDAATCEYNVSIVTSHITTGGRRLRARMEKQIPVGVMELLEYYNKRSDPAVVENLLGAFKFAEAKSWNLDLQRTGSKLKVLISVPARYFDAIMENPPTSFDALPLDITTAALVSSTLEKQLDDVKSHMTRYHYNSRWEKRAYAYSGPPPFYSQFSFLQEAKKLDFFLANLKRFLVLNNKNLRSRHDDIIEIGLDSKYEIQYIILNDELGSHNLKIGLNKLKKTDPFNYPRTMAYIFYLFEMTNELKAKNGFGGFGPFLEKYTKPKPDVDQSNKCEPTWLKPFKCLEKDFPEFVEFMDYHLKDVKCEDLPAGSRTSIAGAAFGAAMITNDLLSEKIRTGEHADFENPLGSAKTILAATAEKNSMKRFKEEIMKENRFYGGSMDFVGDPFVEHMFDALGKFGSEGLESGFGDTGKLIFSKFYKDVVSPFDIKEIILRTHQCLCRDLQNQIEELKSQAGITNVPKYDTGRPRGEEARAFRTENPTDPEQRDDASYTTDEIRDLELKAVAYGCDSLCTVIPILCSCIPFKWPLKLPTIPDFKVMDLLAYLTAIVINVLITALFEFLLELLKGFVLNLLDCDRGKDRSPNRELFVKSFKDNYPWEDDAFSAEDVQEAFRDNNMPPSAADPKAVNALIKDTMLILSPREFCELISGDARIITLSTIETLLIEKYPDLYAVYSSVERIRTLFASIGSLVDPAICENMDELLNSLTIEPAGYICEETSLRDDMFAGRASLNQINQILGDAAKCNTDKLGAILGLVQNMGPDGDIMAGLLPNIFQTPDNPNGIIPRDPPPVKFLGDIVRDSIFLPVQQKFYSEMHNHITTLVTSKTQKIMDSPAGNSNFLKLAIGAASNMGGGDPLGLNDIEDSSQKSIANGFGEALRQQANAIVPIIRENYLSTEKLITLDVPQREIKSSREVEVEPGDNFYKLFPIPGFPTDQLFTLREEKIKIYYDVCKAPEVGVDWSRVRDSYTVQIEDTAPTTGPLVILNFDGHKAVKPEFINVLGDLKGVKSPSQEAFANMLANKWASLPWNSQETRDLLSDPTTRFFEFHSEELFRYITKDLMQTVARIVSKSKFLDAGEVGFLGSDTMGASINFETAYRELQSAGFVPSAACDPRPPGLLNISNIKEIVSERYNQDLADNPQRNINSIRYGLVAAYVRVMIIQLSLDGIFAFSQFKADNILKSNLLISYFMNRMRTELKNLEDDFVSTGNGGRIYLPNTRGKKTGTSGDFYEQLMITISRTMADRKYVLNEDFVDPNTGEEVEVLLDPELVKASLQGSMYDESGTRETLDLERIEAAARRAWDYSSQTSSPGGAEPPPGDFVEPRPEAHESVSDCVSPFEAVSTGLAPSECIPESESTAANETATGQLDLLTGKKTIGYLEFFLQEQFKSVSGEMEALLGTEINDINYIMLDGLFRTVDVPVAAPIGPARFYTIPPQQVGTLSEQDLAGSALDEMREIYYVLQYIEQSNQVPDSDYALLALHTLHGQGAISEEVFDKYRVLFEEGADIKNLLVSGLSVVVEKKMGVGSQSDLIKPEFEFLSDVGGFVLERYIKITEKTAKEWKDIEKGVTPETSPLAIELIKDRDSSLKGVVNLDAWNAFVLEISARSAELNGVVKTSGDGEYFDIQKYFGKWEMGLRLTYVYKLGTIDAPASPWHRFIDQNLLRNQNPSVPLAVSRLKAYTTKEKVDLSFKAASWSAASDATLDLVSSRTYDVFTVPLLEKEMEITKEASFYNYLVENNTGQMMIPDLYHSFMPDLKQEMMQDPSYRALFEYVFPIDRFISLMTIYSVEHVSALPGRPELFDETKQQLRDIYYSFNTSNDRWYEPTRRKKKWWEKPLELSVPGIIFMTPWKILQALLELVPPLKWFLDYLNIPGFPPSSEGGTKCE